MSCNHGGRVPLVYPAVEWYRVDDPRGRPLWSGMRRKREITHEPRPDYENMEREEG